VGGGVARVIRLGVRVPRDRAELVAAELLTLSPAKHLGVIEHHAQFAEASAGFVADKTSGVAAAVKGAA